MNTTQTKNIKQKGKDGDELNIFNLASEQTTYEHNRGNEDGGGMRADDSPLNSVPSDYGTRKSRHSNKVQNMQMEGTVFENYDGDGSKGFRGE